MNAVLLAAGNGGRLRPLTADTAKVMVEVNGRPMLSYSLEYLSDAGITDAVVVVGYLGEQIVDHYGDSYRGIDLEYVRQEQQLGTAHALLAAEDFVTGDFVLVHPDNVYGPSFDLTSLLETHQQGDADASVLVENVDEQRARESGVVERGDDGQIERLIEKPDDPPSTWRVCGSYVLSPDAIDRCRALSLSDTGEYELTDALNQLAASGGRVYAAELDTWVVNVNTPADREAAETALTGE